MCHFNVQDKVQFHTAVRETAPTKTSVGSHVIYLPDSGQVIRALPTDDAPKDVYPQGMWNRLDAFEGYLINDGLLLEYKRYLVRIMYTIQYNIVYFHIEHK